VRSGTDIYRFGPFQLDAGRRRLLRGDDPVPLPDRHLEILLQLAANAGRIISKDDLIAAAWHDVAVADNSIEQAISSLRKTLGTQADGAPYIETLTRRGYRFSTTVERGKPRESDASLDALLAPYRAFVEGRAALETLDRNAVPRARAAFAEALHAEPDYAAAHVGMANACALTFESTRTHAAQDVEALRHAVHHAREGCRLDPSSADAWSTLAFVLHRSSSAAEAIAAARKAVTLDRGNWHHHLRLAFVSWGEERLRAAHRVLTLCPGLALAYWFAATVFIARQAFDAALEQLRSGCASQDAQRAETGRFKAVGLHLLHGLVLGAHGNEESALEEFARELEFEDDGQLYARECAANTWYAIGAIHLRAGRRDNADAAFREALNRVPAHPLAAAMCGADVSGAESQLAGMNNVDLAMANAAVLVLSGKHELAARLCAEALAHAESGPAGWILPVDPVLNPLSHPTAWARTLAMLRDRAA
jgi:DNA-binding winged helix-turn-helix (wHTH) protein/Tfp pilus assembly protein PilF